jgi:hypothetical protein
MNADKEELVSETLRGTMTTCFFLNLRQPPCGCCVYLRLIVSFRTLICDSIALGS